MLQTPSPFKSLVRSLQGKVPTVSSVRETVKEILRTYSNQDWDKLRENRLSEMARLTLEKTSYQDSKIDVLTHIYIPVLVILGKDIPAQLLKDIDLHLPMNTLELTNIRKTLDSNKRNIIRIVLEPINTLIRLFPKIKERTSEEMREFTKIAELFEEAKAGITSVYSVKISTLDQLLRESKKRNRNTAKTTVATTVKSVVNTVPMSIKGGKSKQKTRKNRRR
jgi:hypothetical protein